MATKTKDFQEQKLFQIVRELNVSQDRVVEFLESEGYEDALSGSGLNAKIVDEEAYLVLREEYADDAEAAARIRELRSKEESGPQRDEVTTLEDEPEPTEGVEETPVEREMTELEAEDKDKKEETSTEIEEGIFQEPNRDETEKARNRFSSKSKEIIEKAPKIREESLEEIFTEETEKIIEKGEGQRVEFKRHYRYDPECDEYSRDVKMKILKVISSFLNSDIGGILLIGVGDNKDLIGTEKDGFSSFDEAKNAIGGFIKANLEKGVNILHDNIRIRHDEIFNKEVLRLECTPCTDPVFLYDKHRDEHKMYLRAEESSEPLDAKEVYYYSLERFFLRPTEN